MRNENRIIYVVTISIMLIGLAALYSSTYQRGQRPLSPIFLKQVVWFCLAVVMLFAAANFNYRRLYDYAYPIYVFGILLLLIVLVLGRRILGAQRWLELGGLNFQPSEPMKLGIMLVLCRWFSVKRQFSRYWAGDRVNQNVKQFLLPFVLTAIPAGLVFLQPDLGTAVLYILIFFVILFISGAPIGLVLTPVVSGLLASPIFWHFLKDYQRDRLRVFLNPNIDPLGAGYTIIQSKIAIGSGGLAGRGWLSGTQGQLSFLPESHTDFIFAVIGEEGGLVTALLLLALFYTLVYFGINIAGTTKDRFGSLLACAIVALLAFQVAINLAMTCGICPVVGLVLPFVSYGGSALVIFAVLAGILININKRRMVF